MITGNSARKDTTCRSGQGKGGHGELRHWMRQIVCSELHQTGRGRPNNFENIWELVEKRLRCLDQYRWVSLYAYKCVKECKSACLSNVNGHLWPKHLAASWLHRLVLGFILSPDWPNLEEEE